MIRTLLTAICTLLAVAAIAQSSPPGVKVIFPKSAKAGSTVKGTIEVTFADGLHGYQNPPTEDYQIPVKVTVETKGFSLKATYPKGIMKAIGGETKPSGVYEGTIKIPVTITVPKSASAAQVKLTVHYQECNDQSCFPPDTVSATVKIQITK